MLSLNRFAYLSYRILAEIWWSLWGYRPTRTLGKRFKLHPGSVWPDSRHYKLPSHGVRSRLVAYTDLVQFHAASSFVAGLSGTPVVVDVGAHHGLYALALGHLIAPCGGRLLAVEPNPKNVAILKSNLARNGLEDTVTVEESAVGEGEGVMSLTDHGSESTLSPKAGRWQVPVRSLAAILKGHGLNRVDLLMIDVEGWELAVLRSFPWGRVPCGRILCEIHPYAWHDHERTGEALSQFLKEHDLRCVDTYLQEHTHFEDSEYLGPCLLLRGADEQIPISLAG